MASRFTGSSSMKISSKWWCISSAAVIFSPLFSLCQCDDLPFGLLSFDLPGHSSFSHFPQKYLEGTENGLYETATIVRNTMGEPQKEEDRCRFLRARTHLSFVLRTV